jgi:ABC-2 type transport system ATP-binding protein
MQLEVRSISKRFGEKQVLSDISFTADQGMALGLLGRNGAGKTTTIRIVMDVFPPDEGEVLFGGRHLRHAGLRVGYLPEERGLYPKIPVGRQLVYLAELRGLTRSEARASVKNWLGRLDMGEYLDKKLETLSKGNQQKIQIAQSFVNEPDILILDEPFSGLDPVNAQVFKDAIARFVSEGKLVIFSSHQMGYVEEVCDDVTLIHQGNILLSGDLRQIKLKEGESKLFLSVLKEAGPDWEQALAAAFPGLQITKTPEGLILDTRGANIQGELLRWLSLQGLPIRRFGLYEPSLTDIFIEKAGDRE